MHPKNLASQKVCERIGMRSDGLTSRYYTSECMLFTAEKDR
jgi:RimJ/RimL family protein N-acetyltransferase